MLDEYYCEKCGEPILDESYASDCGGWVCAQCVRKGHHDKTPNEGTACPIAQPVWD